jgi:hypothetical protein
MKRLFIYPLTLATLVAVGLPLAHMSAYAQESETQQEEAQPQPEPGQESESQSD